MDTNRLMEEINNLGQDYKTHQTNNNMDKNDKVDNFSSIVPVPMRTSFMRNQTVYNKA